MCHRYRVAIFALLLLLAVVLSCEAQRPAVPERKRVIEEINIVDIIDEITLYGKDMRSTDGEMYTTKLRAIKIVDMDAAKKLMVGKTVALLPGGYIYTQQGNDMRTILLENKVAEVVPTRFEYDYDTPQQEPDMIKNPAYADPDFSNMFLMLFVSSLALLLVSYRGDTPPSDARIFQSYNRENPIPKRVALILLWFIIGGIVLWLLMVLRVGYRLYNGKTILSD